MNTITQPSAQEKPLRPYQVTACAGMVTGLDAGKRMLLVAPTGAGKTRMSAALLEHYTKLGHKPLALVHTLVLRQQTAANVAGCAVATIQSLVTQGPGGDARRSALADYGVVFIDEAHHIASEEWRAVMPLLEHAVVFGATATPERADGTPLGDVFDDLVVAAKYSELVADGFLCPCDVARPKLTRAEQKKKKVRPDGVQSYLDHCRTDDGRLRPGIYFDSTIAKCEEAAERFNASGIRAAVVCCDTGPEERQMLFDAYGRGELDMLCSPMALSEGFDAPRAEVCVTMRTLGSIGMCLQVVGRVLRPCPGKERALWVDCTDAARVHGMPTDDREYSLTGKGIRQAKEIEKEAIENEQERQREAYRIVRMQFEMVRDRLLDKFRGLQEKAKERNYRPGWVFHQFSQDTGIQPPRIIESKYRSVCKGCRRRLEVGKPMLWAAPQQCYHFECYFGTLSDDQLRRVDPTLPAEQSQEDNIPF
jgi:superfamily II DNA or RNA helicase